MSPVARSAEHWILLALGALFPLFLAAAALFLEPDARGHGTHEQLGLPACTTMDWWGVPCPGCGVTTAVTLAAHGRFLDSLATQPFGVVTLVVGLVFSIWAVRGQLRGDDLWVDVRGRPLRRAGTWLGSLLLLAWVYKLAVTL